MRSLSAVALLLLATLPLRAAETKPNSLTPKEVSDGWLLLFDGQTTLGWQIDGDARVEDGMLVLGGQRETRATPTTRFAGAEYRIGYKVENGAANVALDSGNPRIGRGGFSIVGGKGSVLTIRVEADPAQ